MNKSYKLIKEYPGSPMLGTEQISNKTWNTDIQKFPEFWQEIVEKEYEILSFIVNQSKGVLVVGDIVTKSDNGFKGISSHNRGLIAGDSENDFLQKDHWSIHSVKRLSDGEVFTVGDIFNPKYSDFYTYTLTNIKIINNTFRVSGEHKKDNNLIRVMGNYPLEDIVKSKQPLFTTEDGVEIFEGDDYYELIIPGFHNKECVWNILPNVGRSNLIYDQEGNKKHFRLWFSTEKEAQEYIIMNKPCLSINDLLKLDYNASIETYSYQKIKQLAKQKVGL